MKTRLFESGYGVGVSTSVKSKFFEQDLRELLQAYGLSLTTHPLMPENGEFYIVNKGTSFADGATRVKTTH